MDRSGGVGGFIGGMNRRIEHKRTVEQLTFYPLRTPLTSTSWDGDGRSTTAKTLLDLSAVFGVPAGVQAVDVRMIIRDSGSYGGYAWMILGPNNTTYIGRGVECSGKVNDTWSEQDMIVPCDANGDVYYQIVATGAGTLDAIVEIWGYWL